MLLMMNVVNPYTAVYAEDTGSDTTTVETTEPEDSGESSSSATDVSSENGTDTTAGETDAADAGTATDSSGSGTDATGTDTGSDAVGEETTETNDNGIADTAGSDQESAAGDVENTDGTQTDSADTDATADDAESANIETTTGSRTYAAETASHIQVTAVAEEGAFSSDVTLQVSDLSETDALAIAQKALGADAADAAGVNITFYDANHSEVEPAADGVYVTITFPSDEVVDGDEFHLLHQDDSGDVSEVNNAQVDSDGAAFDASSFSNYVVGSITWGLSTVVSPVFSHAQVAIAAWHQGYGWNSSYDDTNDADLVPLQQLTSGDPVTLKNFCSASASVRGNLLVFAKAEEGYLITGLDSKNSLGNFYPIEGLNGNFTGYGSIANYMGFDNLVWRAYQEGYQVVFGYSRYADNNSGIQFTVDTEQVGIGVTAYSDKEKVVPGDTINVTASITPAVTDNKGIQVSLKNGATYAEIDGSQIAIDNLKDTGNGTWIGSFSYIVTAEDCAKQALNFTVYSGLLYSYAFSGTSLTTSVTQTGSASVSVPLESQTILIRGMDDKVTYDGKEHTLNGFTVNGTEAAAGTDSVNVTLNGMTYKVSGLTNVKDEVVKGTNAGTYTNTVSASDGAIKVYTSQGTDVTSAFKISVVPGTLTIDQRPVTLTSESASKEFDGTALTNEKVTVGGVGFVDGEVSGVEATGSIIKVGSVTNAIAITMNDGFTLDNYDITEKPGTLTITQNTTGITVTASDASRLYDGTPLTSTAVTSSGLPAGMMAVITTDGTITNVGQVTNNITSVKILDKDGNDVTDQFMNILEVSGKLIVEPRKVTLTSGSAKKEFDGTALTAPAVTVTGDGFVDGEVSDLKAVGTITKVGSATNTITYTKTDKFHSENYSIVIEEGTLAVEPNTTVITVTATGASKTYDGQPLTSNGYSVTGLPAGFSLTAKTAGSITNVGMADNTVASVQILDANNKDVTDQFSGVEKKTGTLAVLPRKVTLTSKSDEKVYDGTALTAPDVTISGDGFVNGEVSNVRANGSITRVGSVANTIAYDKAAGFQDKNYTIVLSEGTLTVRNNAKEIVITPRNAAKTYDGTALTENMADVAGLPSGFTVSVTTSGSITDVGSTNNTVASYSIQDGSGNDVTSQFTNVQINTGTLTIEKRKVGLTSQTVSREYDGSDLTAPEVTVSGDGFVNGEVSDIRATGSITGVGSVKNDISYTAGTSFKAGNYEILLDPGTLTVTKSSGSFIILVETESKTYDGTPLTASYSVYAPSGFDGYTGEAVLKSSASSSVSITDAGSIDVSAASYSFKDASGNDVTDYFAAPLLIDGRLTVYPRLLALRSASDEKEYDGKALINASVKVEGDGFAPGEAFDIYATGSQTDVGSSSNAIPSLPETKGKFRRSNYSVVPLPGTLTVTQNTSPIVVTASSQVKIYDGTALTSQMHSVSGLPDGFTAQVSLAGSVMNVSDTVEGNHTVSSVKILRDGKDVTSNFSNITTESGTLGIIPASLKMNVSADTVYDGQEQKLSPTVLYGSVLSASSGAAAGGQAGVNVSFKIRPVSLLKNTDPAAPVPVEGRDYTLSYTVVSGDFVNAGSVIRVTLNAVDGGNYFGTVSAEYHIVPRKLSIVTYSASKDYDGTALTAGGSLSGAVERDGLRLVMTGSQTAAGTSKNTYVIDYGNALASNYVVDSESLGTLTVFALASKASGCTCQDDGYGDGYVYSYAAQACVLERVPSLADRKISPSTGVKGSGE